MAQEGSSQGTDRKSKKEETYRRDINKGYIILYLGVFLFIVIGEIILYNLQDEYSIRDLFQDILGNLMGVLGAFLIFDILHEKLSKDSYASEISEQLLDTLMYHPEAMELYENAQKKTFVNSFIGSIVDDPDVSEMIGNFLDGYLLTKKDFAEDTSLTEKDCRIRPAFSYRFILETTRMEAFKSLKAPIGEDGQDPYFYVQEELNYKMKALTPRGNNMRQKEVKIGFIYDNAELDQFLRGKGGSRDEALLQSCIFREALDIEDADKEMFHEMSADKEKLKETVKKMFRPHLNIDKYRGNLKEVELIQNSCIIVTFTADFDVDAMEHEVEVVFHMPKRWNSLLEIVLVEPTKEPVISLSYDEDRMNIEMYPFLNRSDSSSHENTMEGENGIYSISLNGEWVFPISGVIFSVDRKNVGLREIS